MPWSFTYLGYGVGVILPGRAELSATSCGQLTPSALAQGEAYRSIKAASSKATVGSAYGMAPGIPEDGQVKPIAPQQSATMRRTMFTSSRRR